MLVEAFRDGDVGGVHVGSAHFARSPTHPGRHLSQTPRNVDAQLPGQDWSELGEFAVTS